jgi:hypothetical protein
MADPAACPGLDLLHDLFSPAVDELLQFSDA